MKYRRLGKTELEVSVVGIGTWQFGGEWGKDFSQDEADRILGRAAELGINLVDTAECYGDHLSEEFVGEAIRRDRDRWIVATKFGHAYDGHLKRQQLWSPEAVRKQLDRSLWALQTDRIDLYQFHSGSDDVFDNDELWTMLDGQVAVGKVRFLGISIRSGVDPMHQARLASQVGAKRASGDLQPARPWSGGTRLSRKHRTGPGGVGACAAGQRLSERQVPARYGIHRARRRALHL